MFFDKSTTLNDVGGEASLKRNRDEFLEDFRRNERYFQFKQNLYTKQQKIST